MTKYHKKVAMLDFSKRNLSKEQVIDKYNELIAEYNELVGEIKELEKNNEVAWEENRRRAREIDRLRENYFKLLEDICHKIKVLKRALEFACGIADCNWCIYAKECDTEVIGCAELILQKATAEIEQEVQDNV